jgi:hypothetical protein
MEYYSAIKISKLLMCVTVGIALQKTMLKDKPVSKAYFMVPLK